MLEFNLLNKIKRYGPYSIIVYLLCGGAGMPIMSDIDTEATEYVVEQVEPQANPGIIENLRNKYLGSKNPNQKLPGKAGFTGAQLPREAQSDGFSNILRKLMQLPSSLTGGSTNYGY